MKEKTRRKAIVEHSEKLVGYGHDLHELTKRMLADGCSVSDVVGIFEIEKHALIALAFEEAGAEHDAAGSELDELGRKLVELAGELFGGDAE